MILPIPHFLQEYSGSCVPACVRMILAYLGIERSEIELSAILESERRGTSVMNIELISASASEISVTVFVGELAPDTIKRFLDEEIPVITGVWTAPLPYWQANRPHAVVVIGYDEQSIYLNDPKFPDAPQTVSWEDFLLAWEEFGRFAAVIRRISSS